MTILRPKKIMHNYVSSHFSNMTQINQVIITCNKITNLRSYSSQMSVISSLLLSSTVFWWLNNLSSVKTRMNSTNQKSAFIHSLPFSWELSCYLNIHCPFCVMLHLLKLKWFQFAVTAVGRLLILLLFKHLQKVNSTSVLEYREIIHHTIAAFTTIKDIRDLVFIGGSRGAFPAHAPP